MTLTGLGRWIRLAVLIWPFVLVVVIQASVATVSFYTRHTVTKAVIDGKEVLLGPDRELGLNVFDTPILRIPPGRSITIVLTLDGGVDLADGYEFHIDPQPVANPDQVSATVTIDHAAGGRREVELLEGGDVLEPQSKVVHLT